MALGGDERGRREAVTASKTGVAFSGKAVASGCTQHCPSPCYSFSLGACFYVFELLTALSDSSASHSCRRCDQMSELDDFGTIFSRISTGCIVPTWLTVSRPHTALEDSSIMCLLARGGDSCAIFVRQVHQRWSNLRTRLFG